MEKEIDNNVKPLQSFNEIESKIKNLRAHIKIIEDEIFNLQKLQISDIRNDLNKLTNKYSGKTFRRKNDSSEYSLYIRFNRFTYSNYMFYVVADELTYSDENDRAYFSLRKNQETWITTKGYLPSLEDAIKCFNEEYELCEDGEFDRILKERINNF